MTDFYPSDRYGYSSLLSAGELTVLGRLRTVLEKQVQPLLAEYWEAGNFPRRIHQPLVDLDLMAAPEITNAEGRTSGLYTGFRTFELARTDASVATYYNAQAGLFRTTVLRGGSPEQAVELDPRIRRFEYTGVFALTEPEHGSDIARGMATTARRDGGDWVLNGAKRWIGGADAADVLAVFARDEADGQVKAFLVPRESEGVRITKIRGKTSLRIMQNANIALAGVRVPDSARLARINSFKDVAALMRPLRADVAWIATGLQAGAYEASLRYTRERTQFGRHIADFQLTQQKLATMLANVTASLGMVVRLAQRQEEGIFTDEDSALAKMFTCSAMRSTVALARETAGGNGIVLENDVARFHADAEAVYSYEGTHDINALIVGRALSGTAAFV
ncbi:acyl-CoA dehydrogenase family protein [Arthrobacter gengyunqii]|uniref:Acyl-CoA dehydrogenase family protein n=1 Tax=Arthrobacter gengyunqii TaxID=2886940 RepID=A0ABS8GGT6_9MICC|nr:acyl-CoA dehydrogenase family protein [Arthrobacter gengyunqii]MCC3265804.1 acyl-CoA dehydrogenase family protein [Arthrobacter gengyunqii]